MATQRPAWVQDVKAFAGFTFLSAALTYPCWLVVCNRPPLLDVWYWVFITPARTAGDLVWTGVAWVLFVLNPLIYGLTWWAVWKMVRLLRAKPAE